MGFSTLQTIEPLPRWVRPCAAQWECDTKWRMRRRMSRRPIGISFEDGDIPAAKGVTPGLGYGTKCAKCAKKDETSQ
jgi:hypothetical protein